MSGSDRRMKTRPPADGGAWARAFGEREQLFRRLARPGFHRQMSRLADSMETALAQGGRLLLFGNGGSAAAAQHAAAEWMGRFETERRALAAIALTTDTSVLTAVGNDYGFDAIFSRQVEGPAAP